MCGRPSTSTAISADTVVAEMPRSPKSVYASHVPSADQYWGRCVPCVSRVEVAGPVGAAYEDAGAAGLSGGQIRDARAIERPDRFAVAALISGQLFHGSPFEVQDPHIVFVTAGSRETRGAGRQARAAALDTGAIVGPLIVSSRPSRSTHTGSARCCASGDVHERAVRRNIQHHTHAADHRELLEHGHRRATDRPRVQIERHGLQDSVGREDEVTALDVARVAAPARGFSDRLTRGPGGQSAARRQHWT